MWLLLTPLASHCECGGDDSRAGKSQQFCACQDRGRGAGTGTGVCELAPSVAEWLSEQQSSRPTTPLERSSWSGRAALRTGQGAKGRGVVPDGEVMKCGEQPSLGEAELSRCGVPGLVGWCGQAGVGAHLCPWEECFVAYWARCRLSPGGAPLCPAQPLSTALR